MLNAQGLSAQLRDLRADPPSEAEVRAWREALGEGLLNTRSTTWRGLSEAERSEDPVALMLAHPALIKRPVIAQGDMLYLGWTPHVRQALGLAGS